MKKLFLFLVSIFFVISFAAAAESNKVDIEGFQKLEKNFFIAQAQDLIKVSVQILNGIVDQNVPINSDKVTVYLPDADLELSQLLKQSMVAASEAKSVTVIDSYLPGLDSELARVREVVFTGDGRKIEIRVSSLKQFASLTPVTESGISSDSTKILHIKRSHKFDNRLFGFESVDWIGSGNSQSACLETCIKNWISKIAAHFFSDSSNIFTNISIKTEEDAPNLTIADTYDQIPQAGSCHIRIRSFNDIDVTNSFYTVRCLDSDSRLTRPEIRGMLKQQSHLMVNYL